MLCIVATVAVHYTYINTCYVLLLLLLYTTHIATHAIHCCYCSCTLHTHQHMLCIVLLLIVHMQGQLQLPLNMVTVVQERENSTNQKAELRQGFIVVQTVNISCISMTLPTFPLTTLTMLTGFFLLLPWIRKLSGCGRLLKHLESSGNKVMIRGHIIRQ